MESRQPTILELLAPDAPSYVDAILAARESLVTETLKPMIERTFFITNRASWAKILAAFSQHKD